MAELLTEFEPEIASITLVPSGGGRFEVTINGQLIYSKIAARRHAKNGEINSLVKEYLMKGKA